MLARLQGYLAHLIAPMAMSAEGQAERARSFLLLGSLTIVALAFVIPGDHPAKGDSVVPPLVVLALLWVGSLLPPGRRVLNRAGGILVAAGIFWLVSATGGPESPFQVLYAMLLLFGAVFYGTRRLLATVTVVLALSVVPFLGYTPQDAWGRRVELLVSLAVWSVTVVVIHLLAVERFRQERRLAEQEQRSRSLFVHNPSPVYSLDLEGRFTSANGPACTLVGVPEHDLLGRRYHEFVQPDQLDAVERLFEAARATSQTYEVTVRTPSGPADLVVTNVPIVVDGDVLGVYGLARDVTELKATQAALRRQALHDTLTGLPNRSLLMDRLELAVVAGDRDHVPVGVLLLDLDGFKPVNDRWGHAAGDELLVELARRLTASVRAGDTVCRLGGDEFVVVLPGAGAAAARALAGRMVEALAAPFDLADGSVLVGGSIGAAVRVAGRWDATELLRRADQAMYAAKRHGRGEVVLAMDTEPDASPTLTGCAPGHIAAT